MDNVTRSDHTEFVRCFNEECLKKDTRLYKDLSQKVFGLLNTQERRSISYLKGSTSVTTAAEITEAPPPGKVVPLGELPPEHPAIAYLEDRGFNVAELIARWDLMYCSTADPKYSLASHRIIIPVIQNGIWAGWQGRYIGDIDWKAAKIPKYYTMPSMPKRWLLYNYDVAFKQELVIVTEGPTSCWSVWPYGVALFGKQATIQQQRMIIKQAANKSVIIILDGDAKAEADKLHSNLKNRIAGGVAKIDLEEGKDPGSYLGRESELWSIINRQALEQGMDIGKVLANGSSSHGNAQRND
jgi:5S rRNA maturation endonuclease (ribonuclease M5)